MGAVYDIQQAPDGYLWLTTSRGVFRFDGMRFESVGEATGGVISNVDLDAVFVSRSGALWFTTRTGGMVRWTSGVVSTFSDRRCTPALKTDGVVEAGDGSLWMQARSGLAHLHEGICDEVGLESGYPGGFVSAIMRDSSGTVWVESIYGVFLALSPGQKMFRKIRSTRRPDFAFMHEAPDGSVWVADDSGLRRVTANTGASIGASSLSAEKIGQAQFGNFVFDSDGTLWAGTGHGISRFQNLIHWPLNKPVEESEGEILTPQQGLTSNGIWKVLIDREHDIWVASNGGLDRLRRTPFTALNLPRGQETQLGVASGNRGDVWIGSRTVPLTHISSSGEMKRFPAIPLLTCIRRDRQGTIWAGGAGPTGHLWRITGSSVSVLHYPGERGHNVSGLELDKNGDLWLLLFGGDTYRLLKTGWSNETAALGKKPGVLGTMKSDDAGNVWSAFSNHLVRWDGRTYTKYSFPDGRMNISVMTLFIRHNRVWMGGTGGVLLFESGQFHLLRWKQVDAPGRVSGVVETKDGDLWINGYSGVTHVRSAEIARWRQDPAYAVESEHFEAADGLPGLSGDRTPEPSLVEAADGRLWFATTRSVAWLDPKLLKTLRNRVPPTVKALSVRAEGQTYRNMGVVRLPAHSSQLQIDYTALSLAMPERVLFRYKLDGVDKDWEDAGTRREVSYTNLAPGSYWFHVTAANNDGFWSPQGADLHITIAPAYYQTTWFSALCFSLILIAIWFGVKLRVRMVTSQVRTRLLERLSERERIARELHDTLLQSLFGLMLQFQNAADRLPESDPARPALNRALKQSEVVMTEGRQRIKMLRTEQVEGTTLSDAIQKIGLELEPLSCAQFQVAVNGRVRKLETLFQEETLMIVREAVMNAFTHANAKLIRVELSYTRKDLRIAVLDDGCGIDKSYVEKGRDGHWGLSGMKERASKLQACVEIHRRPTGGTAVEFRVPAAASYVRRPWWDSFLHSGSRANV